MTTLTKTELMNELVNNTFLSAAFTVSRGEKTTAMLNTEAAKAADVATLQNQQNLPMGGMGVTVPPAPTPATLPVLSKLAGVLKHFTRKDAGLAAATKVRFKSFFTGVLTHGQLILEGVCDTTWDAATPEDVSFTELEKLGMHRGGNPHRPDTLCKWVRNTTFHTCTPFGLINSYNTLLTLLQQDTDLLPGELGWSVMDGVVTAGRTVIDTKVVVHNIRREIEQTYLTYSAKGHPSPLQLGMEDIKNAVTALALANPYHVAQEYFVKLRGTWDGVDRVPKLLEILRPRQGTTEEGSEESDALAEAMLRKFLISVAARTMSPGCQVDTMLILQGPQGTKKSSFLEAIAPADRFSNSHVDIGDRDAMMAVQQCSLFEWAELAGMARREEQAVKAFITSRVDRFRRPYADSFVQYPRHCVLAASANEATFLRDETGTRRYWVLKVTAEKIDVEYVKKHKEQIWAQALQYFEDAETCPTCAAKADGDTRCEKHRWWLAAPEEALREEQNEEHAEDAPYVNWLLDQLSNLTPDKDTGKTGVHADGHQHRITDTLSTAEVLQMVGLSPEKCHSSGEQRNMVRAMKKLEFKDAKTMYGRKWVATERTFKALEERRVKNEKKEKKEKGTPKKK